MTTPPYEQSYDTYISSWSEEEDSDSVAECEDELAGFSASTFSI